MAIAQKVAGLLARPGRPAAPRDGQEEEGGAGQAVRVLRAPACGTTATPTRRSRRCGTSCVPFSDYAFNKAHTRRLRPGLLLDRLPQGQLPGRVHGRRCSPASRTTRTSRPSTSTSAAAWASRCSRRTSTTPTSDFTPRGTDIRFGLSAVRNVGGNVVDAIIAARKEKGRFTDFHDFLRKVPAVGLQQAGHRVADQGGRVRLARAPAQGPGHGARAGRRRDHRHQEERGHRPGLACSAAVEGARGPRPSTCRSRRGSGTRRTLLAVRAGDARPVRLRPPAVRRRAHPGRRRRLLDRRAARTRAARTARSSPSAASSPACSARSPRRATPGRSPRWRTSRAPSR